MKKLTLISIPVVGLALLVVSGTALAAARDPVTIYGSNVDLTAPGGPFGEASFTIRDEEFVGTVLVTREAPPEPKGDGIYLPAAVHFFDFGDGNTLTTIGAEYIVPTDEDPDVSTLHGDMRIREATGVFEGVSGELSVNGQIDYGVMQANFESHGTISGY